MQEFAACQFLEALVYKTEAAEKSKAAYLNVPFPKLRYIHLEGTYFCETIPGSISVDILLDCLMERCERKCRDAGASSGGLQLYLV